MKAHPDKGGSEAKMATVNEAYEVLSSPGEGVLHMLFRLLTIWLLELRARFDNGDDPNDPTSGQQGGHPFGPGGHPFQFFQHGGPGQQFQFQWSG